jgi:hypothetical protein
MMGVTKIAEIGANAIALMGRVAIVSSLFPYPSF